MWNHRARILVLRVMWLVGALIVIVGSLLPADSAPMHAVNSLYMNDKVEHGLAYAMLAFLPTLHESYRTAGLFIMAAAIMGILLEYGQMYSPGRSFDLQDMRADFTGLLIGGLAGACLRQLIRK